MSTLQDIENAVEVLKVENLYLLHCVSDYPLKVEDVNLKVMNSLRKYTKYIGYSDHTIGTTAVLAAVSLGADVIEKHFTISKDLPGTDHIFSATPEELKYIVEETGKIELLLGTAEKVMTTLEKKNQAFLRMRFRH